MLSTEIASTAHDIIYDLLEVEEKSRQSFRFTDRQRRDLPSAVKLPAEKLEREYERLTEMIDDVIVGWLVTVAGQGRGESDIYKIDALMKHKLSEGGTLDKAISQAREKYSYISQKEKRISKTTSSFISAMNNVPSPTTSDVAEGLISERIDGLGSYGENDEGEVELYRSDETRENASMIYGLTYDHKNEVNGWYYNTYDSNGNVDVIGGKDDISKEETYKDIVLCVFEWLSR